MASQLSRIPSPLLGRTFRQEKESSTLEAPEMKPYGGCLLPNFPRVLLMSFVNIQAFNSVRRIPMAFG
jgi:hypothetical protein